MSSSELVVEVETIKESFEFLFLKEAHWEIV